MKVFLDAYIFIDVYDEKRKNNKFSSLTYEYLLKNEYSIFTSIDRYFASGESIGIKYDDENLAIDWKIPKDLEILSEGDKRLSNFNSFSSPFNYNTKLY